MIHVEKQWESMKQHRESIPVIIAIKWLVNIPEEPQPAKILLSVMFVVNHMERSIQVIIQEQRNGLKQQRHMKRSGVAAI